MDPSTLDLTSVAGIVAATIAIVHLAKAALGGVPWLNKLPVALYVILVSAGLTWLAHDVLHVLEGELGALLLQAVWQAAAASGVVEWARAGGKPLKATSTARDAIDLSKARALLPLALVIGMGASACSARGAAIAVDVENRAYQTLVTIDTAGDRLTGCVAPATAEQPEGCRTFNRAMAPALDAARTFNRAIRDQNALVALDLVRKLVTVSDALERAVPVGVAAVQAERDRLLAELRALIAFVSSLGRG